MNKRITLMFSIIVVFLFIALAYFYKTISVNYKQNVEIIGVNIKGAVKSPGLYYVEKGSPVALIINKCGGLTANATLPDDFDFSEPLYEDNTLITISRAYSF